MPRQTHAQKVGENDWVFARRRVEEILDGFDEKANARRLPRTPTPSTIAAHLKLAIALFDKRNIDRGTIHEGVLQHLASRWVAMTDVSIGSQEVRRMIRLIRKNGSVWLLAVSEFKSLVSQCERNKRRRVQARRDLHVLGWAILLSQMKEWSECDDGGKVVKELGQLLTESSF